ncbi:hypothetical protein F3Y22_tig00116997pilonHSYRG00685 [Hibiscus syriacus]|uniref:Uncharacterized protein n=1 Tax=Hibiscus syriacus TaxID=106335 RepID=A0A6A2XSP7_HIBSY|nr:hypothetical protein F3Y22_tig00116997pilonHSYRG00685 [Hibiscus syriacus]
MTMTNMDTNKLTRTTADEDEELGAPLEPGTDVGGVKPAVGPDVGVGDQSAGVPQEGEGVVGVVGEGAGRGEPESAKTVMANLWPTSQCRPSVQM